MTRTVALGAVIGFAITVIALAIWERGARTNAAAETVDAGAGVVEFVSPALQRGLTAMPHDRRVERVIVAPVLPAAADAGQP